MHDTISTYPTSENFSITIDRFDRSRNRYRNTIERFLQDTHITINGNNPWDIQVYNPDLYERVLTQGSL